MDEDRYEAIEIIIKTRDDDVSWFDVLSDYLSGDCEGGGGECIVEDGDESDCDDHEHEELLPCTCGLESMGGCGGTLDQCFAWSTNLGGGIQPIDVARVIVTLVDYGSSMGYDDDKVIKWARDEINFENHWNDPIEEETGEENFRELTIDQEEG